MSNSAILKSSLAKKYWMGATGLFLCLFLVGHLAGNLQLVIYTDPSVAMEKFNAYGQFMTTTLPIKILSYVTYISILFHAIDGIILVAQNRKARPERYVKNNAGANSIWSSRNMGVLGTVILVFIVTHMMHFWSKMHGITPGIVKYNFQGEEMRDLYNLTIGFFKDPEMGLVWVIAYVISMIAVAFHLVHGFQSAFQSLGLRHPKYTPMIKKAGYAFAILVPAAFAFIPVFIRFML